MITMRDFGFREVNSIALTAGVGDRVSTQYGNGNVNVVNEDGTYTVWVDGIGMKTVNTVYKIV